MADISLPESTGYYRLCFTDGTYKNRVGYDELGDALRWSSNVGLIVDKIEHVVIEVTVTEFKRS